MGLKYRLKKAIIQKSIKKNNKNEPFQETYSENFQLDYNGNFFDINSYYFSAHHPNGESMFLRKALRGDRSVEVWFCYHTKEATYVNTKQVFDSFNTTVEVTMIESAKKWAFSFQGEVVRVEKDEHNIAHPTKDVLEIEVNGEFQATGPIFDFVTHIDPKLTAEAFAKETWDELFFERMKQNKQAHYEQPGMVDAVITLGKKKVEFSSVAMRDHSFGTRDWNYMDRHIWLMNLMREGTSLNYNLVKYPHVQYLKTGYYEKNHQRIQITGGTIMKDMPTVEKIGSPFHYYVEVMDKPAKLSVMVEPEIVIPFVMQDGKYTVYETIATYKIGSTTGRGISEFGFTTEQERWEFKK